MEHAPHQALTRFVLYSIFINVYCQHQSQQADACSCSQGQRHYAAQQRAMMPQTHLLKKLLLHLAACAAKDRILGDSLPRWTAK